MASTKNLSRKDRSAAKQKARRELKKLYGGLTKKQRSEMREDGLGIRAYLAKVEKAKSEG